MTIHSFGDEGTADVYHGKKSPKARKTLPIQLWPIGNRKLDMINEAFRLEDLRVPPGNRLEALVGSLRGYHSIRINDQWRIVFRWTDLGPEKVKITDYH